MQQELTNNNWIRTLRGKIATAIQIEEFASLWIHIQNVHLHLDEEDKIAWKWTADGQYNTNSAYKVQFLGSYRRYRTSDIWRAQAENKCTIFTWILIQNKVLTSDNLAQCGWPHQDACALCNGPLETGYHLYIACPFAQTVWNQITS